MSSVSGFLSFIGSVAISDIVSIFSGSGTDSAVT